MDFVKKSLIIVIIKNILPLFFFELITIQNLYIVRGT